MRSLRPLLLTLVAATPALAQSPKAPAKGAARTSDRPAAVRPATAPAAAPATYQIDAAHSELTFRIRHLLGRVPGTFSQWAGTIVIDSAVPARSKVDVTIQTASIDTKNEKRDAHLRSADFFAADSFPAITFRSTNVAVKGKTIRITGDLTIRGRSKPVVLVGQYGGQFKDPWGGTRTAFTASTTINRLDYGVTWNKAVESGAMLGDDVTIDIAVEAVRQ